MGERAVPSSGVSAGAGSSAGSNAGAGAGGDAANAFDFATTARAVAAAARALGLRVPSFRSPPRRPDHVRTIRRTLDGAVVSVVVRGRTRDAVLSDLVDGVVTLNRVPSDRRERIRHRLLASVDEPTRRRAA